MKARELKGAVHSGGESAPFWETTPLNRMTPQQWESLCDRCGRCCLHKIEDEATGRIIYTSLACRLLDRKSCLCGDYENRRRLVPWCVTLTPSTADLPWLPSTCAYRLLARGEDLHWWHPLVSGSTRSVHDAGMSARSMALGEELVHPKDLEEYLDETDRDLVPFDREHI